MRFSRVGAWVDAVGASGTARSGFDAGLVGRGVGHVGQDDDLGLVAVVERTAETEAITCGQAQAALEEVEGSLATDGQRGAGVNDRWSLVVEQRAERGPDVERRVAQRDSLAAGTRGPGGRAGRFG